MDVDGNRNLEAGHKFQMAAELILGGDKDVNGGKMSKSIEETSFQSSISVYDSVFNAAVAYRQAGRHDLAEKFYRKAVQIKPQVINHCSLNQVFFCLSKPRVGMILLPQWFCIT